MPPTTHHAAEQPASETQQPSATLLLIAYNQARYVEEACLSALAQTYSPLEIIFSDDASPDDTFEIMSRVASAYKGTHKVTLNKNKTNLGLIGHINHGLKLAHGDFIVAAAGDDISNPDRVAEIMFAYKNSEQKAMLIHSAVTNITQDGHEIDISHAPMQVRGFDITDIAKKLLAYQGSSGAWNRKLHEQFGDILYTPTYEDLIFAFRAALLDGIIYIDKPLVKYRIGVGISTFDRLRPLSHKERRAQRIKQQTLAENIFLQRLHDLSLMPEHPNFAHLFRVMTKLQRGHSARISFLKSGLIATIKSHGLARAILYSLKEAIALKS